jgi:F-type H+-transporting ATPase subunit b
MDSLIETFHIDIRLLVAQFINFAIVISVLYFFAVKPITKIMQDRTKKIEKSLDDAKKIDARMLEAEAEFKKTVSQAKIEAGLIMENVQMQAEVKRKEMLTKTKEEIGQIINDEKAMIQQEKAKILKEIKEEVTGLVISSVEKILEKKMDKKDDEEIIKKIIKHK